MEARPTRSDIDSLLAHADWLQALAASLVRDPGTADDVVQDTWLAALAHAPAGDQPLEPWLARVARNFALRRRRDAARRTELECEAGPSAEAPTPAQTAERLDLQRSVVEALLTVDEPFRTVLVQRYFEGRSAAEIARVHRVPAGTVRWRLKRGLDELRERLDGRFGSRASWAALLVPLVHRSAPASVSPSVTASKVLTGVLAMSAMKAGVLVAGMVVVTGVLWWSLDGRASSPAKSSVVVAQVAPEPSIAALDPERGGNGEHEPGARIARPAESPSEPTAAAPVTSTARSATVDVRFVDPTGAPLGGVRFGPEGGPSPWTAWSEPTLSEADGRARLELAFAEVRPERKPVDECQVELIANRAGSTTVGRSVMVRVGGTTHLGDVELGPAVRLSGRVVDELGRAVANSTIGTTAAELPPAEDGRLQRHGSDSFGKVPSALSSEDGSFVLDGIGAGTWRLWGHAEGMRYAWTEPIEVTAERDLLGLELVLTPLLPGDRIEGRIVDTEDRPVRAGLMCLVHRPIGGRGQGVEVDEQGRFLVVIEHDDETWDFTALDLNGPLGTTSVTGVRPGTLDLVIRMREARLVTMLVRDDEGQPVEHASFLALAGALGSELDSRPSAPGDYRTPVPEAPFRLEVSAPGFRTRNLGPLDPASLPDAFDVVLQRAPFVRGQVTADGRPLEHARVELRRDDPASRETVNGFRCVMWSLTDAQGRTDASGRFELTADFDEDFWIRVTADGFAPAEIGPIDARAVRPTDDLAVVLDRGGAIEGRVLLAEGDGEGAIVAINHGDGSPRTMRAGPQGHFRFELLAPGRWQVLPSAVELDPSSNSYASTDDADPIEWSCEVLAGRTTRFDLDLRPK